MGPGFPRCLGAESPLPFAAAADRLTPFFLPPSTGGASVAGPGVPSGCGVAALESDASSPFVVGAADGAAWEAGDDLTSRDSCAGVPSSLVVSRLSRSPSALDGTLIVWIMVGFCVPDFRRADSFDLAVGAMVENANVDFD